MIAVEQELTVGDPGCVALGRSLVTRALGSTEAAVGLPASILDDAVLAASELVTNAVAAATGRICVSVQVVDGVARVAVYDDGPGTPTARWSTPDRPHGRGLSIVGVLSARWGVLREPPGKWVWAEFPVAVAAAS